MNVRLLELPDVVALHIAVVVNDEVTGVEDLSPPLDDILHLEELKGDVTTALRSLDEKSQRILEMKYMLDLSNAEIADELQSSVDSLRMSLIRARRKLKIISWMPTLPRPTDCLTCML